MMNELMGLLLLGALGVAAFAFGILRRARFVNRGRRVAPQRDGVRLRPFATLGRMAARPPVALAHTTIILGLILFVPRLATLAGRILDPGFIWLNEFEAWRGFYVALWAWARLALLAAIGFFLLRRWVLKPRHLVRSLAYEMPLFWLALVMTGDLVHELSHSALLLQAEMVAPYPVAGALGHMLLEAGFYKSELVALSRSGLWAALGGAVIGLATMPFGRNLHRLTGWFTVPLGQRVLPPVGVSRKHLLDAITCTQCGRCDAACERRHDSRALRPSTVPTALSGIPGSLSGHELLAAWVARVGPQELTRCDGCGDCDASCPLAISLLDGLVTLADAAGLKCPIPHVEKLEDE